jgi:arylsulfatase A-like enzyme
VQISETQVGRAIRTQRWKYSVYAPDKDGNRDPASDHYVEQYLYDLEHDPHERKNLVTDPAHLEVRSALRQRLLQRMAEVGEAPPTISPMAIKCRDTIG